MLMRKRCRCGLWRLSIAAGLAAAIQISNFSDAHAQGKPSDCVVELKKEYGSTNALRSGCATETDCTFQAPPANASALALIGTMVKRTEDCFAAAGLKMSKEVSSRDGTTRYYQADGAPEKCAVLIATGTAGIAEGVRAVCQPTP